MDISAVGRSQTTQVKPKKDILGVMVAQKSLEAAMQNQSKDRVNASKEFAHPYLGHNVDIYV